MLPIPLLAFQPLNVSIKFYAIHMCFTIKHVQHVINSSAASFCCCFILCVVCPVLFYLVSWIVFVVVLGKNDSNRWNESHLISTPAIFTMHIALCYLTLHLRIDSSETHSQTNNGRAIFFLPRIQSAIAFVLLSLRFLFADFVYVQLCTVPVFCVLFTMHCVHTSEMIFAVAVHTRMPTHIKYLGKRFMSGICIVFVRPFLLSILHFSSFARDFTAIVFMRCL